MSLRTFESFTVLCEPPFFRALIIWRGIGTWVGGGRFDGRGVLHISSSVNQGYMHGAMPSDQQQLVVENEHQGLSEVTILPPEEA